MIRKRNRRIAESSLRRNRRINEGFDDEARPRVYVGTYRLYNEGSLEGDWFDLTEYDDKNEFYKALKDRFKGIDPDPEYMFQDHEYCGNLVSESSIDDKLFDLIKDFPG